MGGWARKHCALTQRRPAQGVQHADVMRELSTRWKAQQRAAGGADDADAELGSALRALDLSNGDD